MIQRQTYFLNVLSFIVIFNVNIDLCYLFKLFHEKMNFTEPQRCITFHLFLATIISCWVWVAGRLKPWRLWWKQLHAGWRLIAHYLTGGCAERRCILEKKARLSADEIPDVPGGSSRAPGFLSPRLCRLVSFFFLLFSPRVPDESFQQVHCKFRRKVPLNSFLVRANSSMIWLLIHLGGGRWGFLGFCACQRYYYLKAQKLKSNWTSAPGCL